MDSTKINSDQEFHEEIESKEKNIEIMLWLE